MLDAGLPALDEGRRSSADPPGEVLWVPETLGKVPGLASVVRLRDISASLLAITSRLLETAARLVDPLDRPKKVELDNYIEHADKVRNCIKIDQIYKLQILCISTIINY